PSVIPAPRRWAISRPVRVVTRRQTPPSRTGRGPVRPTGPGRRYRVETRDVLRDAGLRVAAVARLVAVVFLAAAVVFFAVVVFFAAARLAAGFVVAFFATAIVSLLTGTCCGSPVPVTPVVTRSRVLAGPAGVLRVPRRVPLGDAVERVLGLGGGRIGPEPV